MEIKADKQHIVRWAIALVLAAAIILASVITVAAAAASTDEAVLSTEEVTEKKLEVELHNGDLMVSTNRNLDITLEIIQAYNITIDNCGEQQNVQLAKGTVSDALVKAGIELAENQAVKPSLDTQLNEDTEICVYNAKTIEVTADGKTRKVQAPTGTVGDALEFLGYNADENDIITPDRKSDVEDGMEILLQRVTYKNEVSTEKIAYDTVRENSDKVELGETKVSKNGVNGEQQVTKKCKYVDGELVSSEVVDTKTTKEPVDEVVLVGTKGAASSGGAGTFTDNNGNTVAYSYVLTGSGTAYTAPAGAGTATGVPAYHGGVAVNPNIIPYGSKLYIESTDGSFVYGYATAVDTGGALMDGSAIVDVFYDTYGECVVFGRRNVNVYVIA